MLHYGIFNKTAMRPPSPPPAGPGVVGEVDRVDRVDAELFVLVSTSPLYDGDDIVGVVLADARCHNATVERLLPERRSNSSPGWRMRLPVKHLFGW
jgi:hypothetical protein